MNDQNFNVVDDEFGDLSSLYVSIPEIVTVNNDDITQSDICDKLDDLFPLHKISEDISKVTLESKTHDSNDIESILRTHVKNAPSKLAKKLSTITLKDLQIKYIKRKLAELPNELDIAFDTEFHEIEGLLCISAYVPYFKERIYIEADGLNEDFNLIDTVLEALGFESSPIAKRKAKEIINNYWKHYFPKKTEKHLDELKTFGDLPNKIAKQGINLSEVTLSLNKRKEVQIRFRKFKINLISFYGFADLFKVFGRNVSSYLWSENAKIQQFRTIKIMGSVHTASYIDGVPCDFELSLFDTRYVFPPIPASLDNQLRVYGVKQKIKMSDLINRIYGIKLEEQWIKENMGIVKRVFFAIFHRYAVNDAVVTYKLYERLHVQFTDVGEILELQDEMKLGETCGGNIQKILLNLIHTHFGTNEESGKLLDEVISKSTAKNLAKLRGNDYGVMPFLVSGGLLFTRVVRHPLIQGLLFDLDESSAYATILSAMNMYLGQPRVHTFFNNKPTLRERFEQVKAKKLPHDSYYFVVSGKLKKAINTLIPSDLRFKDGTIASDYKSFSFEDALNEEKETINLFDASKITEPCSHSKILPKEIYYGKVTFATLTVLKDLPEEWYEEYLDLKVDCEIYHDPNLLCYSIEEYLTKIATMPDDEYLVTDIPEENLGKSAKWIPTKSNVTLVFPLAEYYQKIKEIRKQYKNAKNPIQEIFKLTLNSTYGIFASLVLKVNNPIAANWITSCCRAAAWRMTNALNGFAPITDGTGFNMLTVPFGRTFKELLAENPNYLVEYDPTITNYFDKNWIPENEGSFNDIYIEHLQKFLGKTDWLIDLFKYDLKDEKGQYKFDQYTNTNAGNYCKIGDFGIKQKTRSYRSFPAFTEWYKTSCSEEYTSHIIYVERELLQLSSGSEDALRILKDANDLINLDRSSVKMTRKLAESILENGLVHPMGHSKNTIKLMKLVSPSQFYYQDKEQFGILDRLYQRLKCISKEIIPFDWKELDKEYLTQFYGIDNHNTIYPVEIREYNYSRFNMKSPIGLGFELLIFGNRNFKTIGDIRCRIQDLLNEYKLSGEKQEFRLDGLLNIQRTIKNLTNINESKYLIHLLAATQIIKLNFEMDYREKLVELTSQPTYRHVGLADLTTLKLEKDKI